MRSIRRLATVVALSAFAAACGGPKTEADRVKLALQTHLNGPKNCQATAESVILPWEVRDTDQSPTAQRLRAMAAAKMVTTQPTTVRYAKAQVPATAFAPADNLITVKESTLPMFANVRFCFARKQVSELTDAVPEGAAAATVRFTYVLTDAPAWTKDPGVQLAFPDIARAMAAGGGSGSARLTRNGEAWTVASVT